MSKAIGFDDADDFYQRLVEVHESLDDEQTRRFDLALIFMLANHVGDKATLATYIEMAQDKEGRQE